jgi:hypothetical protein
MRGQSFIRERIKFASPRVALDRCVDLVIPGSALTGCPGMTVRRSDRPKASSPACVGMTGFSSGRASRQ